MTFRLVGGDAIEAMQAMAENSVDAIVTDPPYGLEFMGKEWDALTMRGQINRSPDKPNRAVQPGPGSNSRGYIDVDKRAMQEWHHAWATEALRILKPGGHLLAFGGTRTYHRLACAIEDAGFEIRDCLAWMYGSGFPKSLDVSKAIDKAAGVTEWKETRPNPADRPYTHTKGETSTGWQSPVRPDKVVVESPEAQRWNGWGTALKPAWESIIVATKPQVMSDLAARIGSCLLELSARVADGPSTSSPSASGEAFGSAPSSAAAKSSTSGGSSDPTATSQSGSVTPTPSSIALSWKACWDDLCELTSMFTTGTTSSTTTALATLSSCLEQITPAHITAAPSGELSSLAHTVDSLLAALRASSSDTLMLSAIVSATAPVPGSSPVVGDPEPAFEPIVLARKPLSERNVAANVQRWGTGALNIDGCRVEGLDGESPTAARYRSTQQQGNNGWDHKNRGGRFNDAAEASANLGRWPANVTLGHSPDCEQTGESRKVKASRPASGPTLSHLGDNGIYGEADGERANVPNYANADGLESVPVWNCAPGCAVAMLDEQTGERRSGANPVRRGADLERLAFGEFNGQADANPQRGAEVGAASRFFYCPKADREERNRGLGHMDETRSRAYEGGEIASAKTPDAMGGRRTAQNHHPTVKPVELMRWLCRMVTPKGGTVLDPFTGSGSTGVAAMREGFEFIGIEREAEYVEIARARIIGDAPLFNLEAVGGGPPNE